MKTWVLEWRYPHCGFTDWRQEQPEDAEVDGNDFPAKLRQAQQEAIKWRGEKFHCRLRNTETGDVIMGDIL